MQRGTRLTTEAFIEKAKVVHGSIYDYKYTVFVKTKEKVVIWCQKHGEFSQRADSHLAGHGCPKCSPFVKTSFQDFCAKQHQVHGGFFSYVEESYDGLVRDMRIVCPVHGTFTKSPSNHLQGQGCPSCKSKTLGLYLLRCTKTGLLKIGVTQELPRRLKELPKSLVVLEYVSSTNAYAIESYLHKKYQNCRTKHPDQFGGSSTEFFSLTDDLLANIVEYLKTV